MSGGHGDDDRQMAEDEALAEQLRARRPVPGGGFRGALGRHLSDVDPGYAPRPVRLRLYVAGYVAVALIVLLMGLLQATGSLS
jgi:hypothetical protein